MFKIQNVLKGFENSALTILTEIITEQSPAVLIVVAVDTEVLPVGAVRGVVPVIPVLMVNGEEVSVLIIKLPGTLCTDKTVNPQGLFPVIIFRCADLFQFPHYLFNGLAALFFRRSCAPVCISSLFHRYILAPVAILYHERDP